MTTNTTFWNLITNYKISIPLIQRDYAYGRVHVEEKRDKFLNIIHEHLTNNKNLHLDFVYGQVDGDTFCPIVGQQRLTTLFLIHWYFSLKENIEIENRKILDRFVYETRISCREFCHDIVHKEIEIPPHTLKRRLSDTIKNKFWYRNTWDNDPTIQSMLVMIDSIHQKFKNSEGRSIWDCLTEGNIISFELLDMGNKGYNLTDQLYIKLNARGKQLTHFENFKSKFIQFAEKHYKGKNILHPVKGEVSYASYFAHKIEKEWTNLFWAFREDNITIDDVFSNYLEFITQLLYFKINKEAKAEDFTNSFSQYVQIYSDEEYLLFLFNSLDKLHELSLNSEGKVDKEILNQFYTSITNKKTPFWNTQLDIPTKVRLFENLSNTVRKELECF